jgi:long-chain acyl-CoA synthetase
MAVETLSDLVFHVRDRSAGRPELQVIKRGQRREALSTSDFLGAIHSLALAVEARGLTKGDRLAIFAENRPEWHIVDFACQLLGVVSVPIYPTLTADQVAYILRNSGATWVIYSDRAKGELLRELEPALTRPPTIVAMDEDGAVGDEELSLVHLLGEGARERSDVPLDRYRGRVAAEDLASIIYTSGTTGDPKGVMLSHRNFVANFLDCVGLYPIGPDDIALSFLPLSHVFERTVDHLFFYLGVKIHYAPSIERVPPLLLEVRPTILTSVPRLYERAYLKVLANVEKESPRSQKVFRWAIGLGKRHRAAREQGRIKPLLAAQRRLAERLVYRKIKDRFGGRLRFAISGGAPLVDAVGELFNAVGIPLYQGYGLTESAPVLTANTPAANRLGSVGRALPSVELHIAADGEILAGSPGVMMGYWENPGATAEVIGEDGWLHTGDVGHLDDDGFLFITDRKKDLLVTSGGKNVAPQPIEQQLTSHRIIGQAVVVGDGYPYLTALLVPRFDELSDELASLPRDEVVEHPTIRREVEEALRSINRRLSEHERVRRYTLLAEELTLEKGELTPTLKVRRRIVMQRYAELIAGMYLKTQRAAS